MAKPTRDALPLTIAVAVIAAAGIVLGFIFNSPATALLLLLPTIAYEIYRVEGDSTRYAAWGLLGVVIVELALLLFNVTFDLASFLNTDSQYIQGYEVPLADIKVIGPILLAILAVVLFKNTRGRYTKALSVVIIVAAFAIVFMLNPEIFNQMLRVAGQEGVQLFNNL
ncbi:MAG: hypothetical protein TR69_WS6001000036 [candidate division WS6 bacterium OLB20]|uniref:Uncharacterized protein n=1 Tax=candidate division WS6 bacterium OLB20 TaxID=1617426 RepID=A0A136M108_9BACT|nr:MAG: hypothetical protein TR69_WS6001000036 [candidate division WS6 bacterium OLB20]